MMNLWAWKITVLEKERSLYRIDFEFESCWGYIEISWEQEAIELNFQWMNTNANNLLVHVKGINLAMEELWLLRMLNLP